MSFGRNAKEKPPMLPFLEERDLGNWPETDTPEIGEPHVVDLVLNSNPRTVSQKTGKALKHPQHNECAYSWINKSEMPKPDTTMAYIYAIVVKSRVIGVGETNDLTNRMNAYCDCIKTLKRDGSTVIEYMQQLASKEGHTLHFEVMFLEFVPREQRRIKEGEWIQKFLDDGEPIVNRTREINMKTVKSKAPKPVSEGEKGGGWQVKTEWIGTCMKVQCKKPFDGSIWECDHDALVDAINASLKKGGRTLIGEPGPSEKQYGASSGLRAIELWTRV